MLVSSNRLIQVYTNRRSDDDPLRAVAAWKRLPLFLRDLLIPLRLVSQTWHPHPTPAIAEFGAMRLGGHNHPHNHGAGKASAKKDKSTKKKKKEEGREEDLYSSDSSSFFSNGAGNDPVAVSEYENGTAGALGELRAMAAVGPLGTSEAFVVGAYQGGQVRIVFGWYGGGWESEEPASVGQSSVIGAFLLFSLALALRGESHACRCSPVCLCGCARRW